MKIKDFEIPIGNALFGSQAIKTGYKSLKKWLGNLIKGVNGITFDLTTFSFGLGGEIKDDINIEIVEGKSFSIVGENGNGLFQFDDSGNAIFLGNVEDSIGLSITPTTVSLTSVEELNIISNLLTIKDDDGNAYFELYEDSGDVFVKAPNLPVYADEAAAQTGGLGSGTIYRTSAGALRIKL